MVDARAAAAVPYRKRIIRLGARVEELEALLRDAVRALDDLGACSDPTVRTISARASCPGSVPPSQNWEHRPPRRPRVTEDERNDVIGLLPKDMVIWADDEELEAFPWTFPKWMDVLGHQTVHSACCASCGCAITCTADAFHESLISSVVRELDKLGALRLPAPLSERNTDA